MKKKTVKTHKTINKTYGGFTNSDWEKIGNDMKRGLISFGKADQEIIDQVKKLPISEEKQKDIIATMEMYSGPIPHPKILAGYQALYPDAAKEIIENGLDESRHRRQLETARQKRRGHLAWASMILLVIVCLIFMGRFI